MVLGEGAAMLLLEPLARARRRGARIYACIAGSATFGVAAPRYDWPARLDAQPAALAALVGGRGVDLVLGGANSSPRLDACELALVARLPGAPAILTSIKGAIGEHGAAGALTTAAACLAVYDQTVPPLANLRRPLGDERARLAARTAERRAIARALVCGLARGGAGAALLLTRADA
jgi:3-oxoacyl-(acyl-carrier-protein) synthase